jgi:hypothetical protein
MPEQLSHLIRSGQVNYGQMAKANISGPVYSLLDEERVRDMMTNAGVGTGSVANVKWLFYDTFGTFIPSHPASNEDLIDAFQQGISTSASIATVKVWVKNLHDQIVVDVIADPDPNTFIDPYWAYHRSSMNLHEVQTSTDFIGSFNQSPTMVSMINRELKVRAMITDMMNTANNKIGLPAELEGLIDSVIGSLGEHKIRIAGNQRASYRMRMEELESKAKRARILFSGLPRPRSWAAELVLLLQNSDEANGVEATNMTVLKRYVASHELKKIHPNNNWDRWLFYTSTDTELQPWMWLIRAVLWYREQGGGSF